MAVQISLKAKSRSWHPVNEKKTHFIIDSFVLISLVFSSEIPSNADVRSNSESWVGCTVRIRHIQHRTLYVEAY